MNNATDNQSGQWPVRSASAAAELQRTREMPLLFQLADINRRPAAVGTAPAVATPAKPAPIELPTPSSFPLASTALEPWPRPTTGLFEMPAGLSTAALAIGAAAPKEKEEAKTASLAASTAVAVETVTAEKLPTEKATAIGGLPAAIESAVKAAAETNDAAETKTSVKAEAKAGTKADIKPEEKATAKKDTLASTKAPVVETIVTADARPADKIAGDKPATDKPATDKPATDKPAADKPSPASLRRQRAEARQAKVEGSKGGDWLSTHGKIIAIGFVIALLGTIYLARRNRGAQEPAPSLDTPNLAVEIPGEHDHDAHDHKPTEAANTAPRLVEAPSHPLDATPSPATTVAPSVPDANNTAELQSPVVPNAGQTTTPPSSEPLFPWQNDPRMASRPDQPTQTPATSAPTFVPPHSNPAPTAPALNAPTYPETNLRDAPLLPPAPPANNGAPPTNYPTNGQGGSSGHVPASFSPASFTSAPGGNRYERTGSGLY